MPELTTVTLPAGLTGIPRDAFANSVKLATVKFGDASTSNGGGSQRATTGTLDFSGAKALASIGKNAFAGTAATTVDLSTITANFTTINDYVFKDMTSLAEVKLPSSITQINQSAFQNDAALKKLSTNETANNAQAKADEATTTATFGSKLISIGNQAFYGTGFTTVDLSKAVGTPASGGTPTTLTVGSNAFTNMADLATVKLPKDSNINPGNFGNPTPAEGTTPKLKTIMYGTNAETDPATFKGDGSTFSGTNYNKISNETIDLTGYANLTTLGAGVLFGNTAMKTLKMNAPIMSLSNTTVSVADPV